MLKMLSPNIRAACTGPREGSFLQHLCIVRMGGVLLSPPQIYPLPQSFQSHQVHWQLMLPAFTVNAPPPHGTLSALNMEMPPTLHVRMLASQPGTVLGNPGAAFGAGPRGPKKATKTFSLSLLRIPSLHPDLLNYEQTATSSCHQSPQPSPPSCLALTQPKQALP